MVNSKQSQQPQQGASHLPIEYVKAALVAIPAGLVFLFLFCMLAVHIIFSPGDFASLMSGSLLMFFVVLFLLIAIGVAIGGRLGKHRHGMLAQELEGVKLDNELQRTKINIVKGHAERIDTGIALAAQNRLPFELTAAGTLKITPLYPSLHTLGDTSQQQVQLPMGQGNVLHIPTFSESMERGDIGVGQQEMLFCYEIVAPDGQTAQALEISPIKGEIGALHTQFIAGGSQSGKTTYMSGIVGQAAAMRTLFYVIDPHKIHPEKSISAKIAAFSPYFILPPASTHEEVARVLAHATKTRDRLIQGQETPYQGYHIMFIVDEVPALMAYQKSQDKQVKSLYLSLALFMQSIGTQTAKFGMTGLFGSQFVTKDELGDIEIRDACMSQFLLRLHPTQAQAMRILPKAAIQEIPRLSKGHGYLMLSTSYEPMRVASGNVTQNDLTRLASQLPGSPSIGETGLGEQVRGTQEVQAIKYLAPHLEGDIKKVYDACKQLQQVGERISSRRVGVIAHINRDKANNLIGELATRGLIVRRLTD